MKSFFKKYWLLIVIAGIAIISIVWYFITMVPDPNKSNTPVPDGSPTPKWIPEVFKLDVGMYGKKIKALQKKLGIADDGKFGNQTKASVIAAGKTVPLSEPDYNAIVNPAASGGGANFQKLKAALGANAINFSGGVKYPIQGQNKNYRFDFYTNGRFFLNTIDVSDNIAKGSYTNGGQIMAVDGGNTYNMALFTNMTNIVKDYGQ